MCVVRPAKCQASELDENFKLSKRPDDFLHSFLLSSTVCGIYLRTVDLGLFSNYHFSTFLFFWMKKCIFIIVHCDWKNHESASGNTKFLMSVRKRFCFIVFITEVNKITEPDMPIQCETLFYFGITESVCNHWLLSLIISSNFRLTAIYKW